MAGRGNPVPRVVVVGVGDEILYGHTVNTNGSWLGGELSSLGFRVLRQEVVGDEAEAIRGALVRGLEDAEAVVVTGGLGPTDDDLTRDVVADCFGAPLQEDPVVLEALRKRFLATGRRELPSNARQMAWVPRDALTLPNPRGAAPGLVLTPEEGRTVVLLPGVPGEMRGIFREGARSVLKERHGGRLRPVHHRVIHTTGIPESFLAQEMGKILPEELAPVSLAFLPDMRGVRVRFTVQGVGPEEAEDHFDALEARLEGLLRPYRYRSERGDLAEALGRALEARGLTMATAESCTGGLVAKRMTDQPGASSYFLGGVVAYANEAKVRQLGVPEVLLEQYGAVCPAVAKAMALGAAQAFGTEAGVGITGIAGPSGGSEEKPVGTVSYAACLEGVTEVKEARFLGQREAVRERAAQAAMALLLAMVEGQNP